MLSVSDHIFIINNFIQVGDKKIQWYEHRTVLSFFVSAKKAEVFKVKFL